jgi:hypothetical protein
MKDGFASIFCLSPFLLCFYCGERDNLIFLLFLCAAAATFTPAAAGFLEENDGNLGIG